jgi:hypothetical protein
VSTPLPTIATCQNLQSPVGLAWTASLQTSSNGWPAVLNLGQDRHPPPTTLRTMPPFQRRTPPPSPNTEPYTIAIECSAVLGRPKSHAERRRLVTVLYALTSRRRIGGIHFHPRRSGGGCKPDVPPRAHTTLQNPTLFVAPRVYSRRPIAAFCAMATAIRRATQHTILRFQTTEESRVEFVLPCHRKWWRAGHLFPRCQATRALASSNRRMTGFCQVRVVSNPASLLVQVCARILHFSTGQHVDTYEQTKMSMLPPTITARWSPQLPARPVTMNRLSRL